jgi:hypothetical protein
MRRGPLLLLLAFSLAVSGLAAPAAEGLPGPAYASATVDKVKTSIYVGSITLEMPPFRHVAGGYESTYAARVFPYFFYNEKGRITIDLPAEHVRRLAAGERVEFVGRAQNLEGEPRRVEGHAIPEDAFSGTIKVRIWVSPKIELIFNSRYRFTGQ